RAVGMAHRGLSLHRGVGPLTRGESVPSTADAGRRRSRDFLLYAVVRPLFFIFWSLVVWGTALLFSLAFTVVARGPGTARPLLTPPPNGGWTGWLNVLLVPFALVVWTGLGVALWQARR